MHKLLLNGQFLFPDAQKSKVNMEKPQQAKPNGIMTKVNGENPTSISDDSKKDETSTKEPILNGTEITNENIVNGDPKIYTDCDISSSDNGKIVTNGVASDSDDNKSEEAKKLIFVKCSPATETEKKQTNDKKKVNKKTSSTEKTNECDKKKVSATDKVTENNKKDEVSNSKTENELEKTNGIVQLVNGDKDRESSPSEDGDEKKKDGEVVFIQDLGFTVKIVSPGAEPLDIQV